jgi:hypothetical protein
MVNVFRPIQSRLRWRLIVYFLPVVILPLLVFSYFQFTQWQTALSDEVDTSQSATVDNLAADVSAFFTTVEGDLRFFAESEATQNLAEAVIAEDRAAIEMSRQQVAESLLLFANNHPIYKQLRFIDFNGNELSRVDIINDEYVVVGDEELDYKGDRGYFIETIDNPAGELYVSQLNLNRIDEPPAIEGSLIDGSAIPVVRYAVPIYVDDAIAGIFVLNVSANLFH